RYRGRIFPLEYHFLFFFSSRRRHTRLQGDWSSDVCSSDLRAPARGITQAFSLCALECPGPQAISQAQLAREDDRLAHQELLAPRSEERRVGKECRSWCANAH